jgi:nicotinamidase-related amidase
MPGEIELRAETTAVMCMDYQNGIVSAYAGNEQDEMLSRASHVLDRGRSAGMKVIYIHVGFRPGFPEVSLRNQLFSAVKSSPERQKMFESGGSDVHEAVAPKDGDIIIMKHRVSAFHGTDLEMILRANEIDTLVLFGIATSGVVLSTLVDAADRDYRIFVIKDCCADRDPELHSSLIERYFPNRGTVVDADEFIKAA